METAFIGMILALLLSIAAHFPHIVQPLFRRALMRDPKHAGQYQFYALRSNVALLVAETFVVAQQVDKNVPRILRQIWWEIIERGTASYRMRLRLRFNEVVEQMVPASGGKGQKKMVAQYPVEVILVMTCIPYEARTNRVPLTAVKFQYLQGPRGFLSPGGRAAFDYTVNQINLALAQAEAADAQRRPALQMPEMPVVTAVRQQPAIAAPPAVTAGALENALPPSFQSAPSTPVSAPPISWPTPQEYNECVQNPGIAFADEELRRGAAECNQLGLPRPISGAFASVYKMYCGQREWAVKCFLSPMSDQSKRYRLISEHLKSNPLSCTMGFEYMEKGVFVRGGWFPVLKMEWVEGTPLNEYVGRIFANRQELDLLADNFLATVEQLQICGIAHGDLQHGNILVADGQCRLVDYDGMFVPSMRGLASCELGHRNYQHPRRTETNFGRDLDNFSAWIIYLSLRCLSFDYRFWHQFGGGDECLIFRQADLAEPATSPLVVAMERHESEHIRDIALAVKQLCAMRLEDVPAPDPAVFSLPRYEDYLK